MCMLKQQEMSERCVCVCVCGQSTVLSVFTAAILMLAKYTINDQSQVAQLVSEMRAREVRRGRAAYLGVKCALINIY